jgi:hypothetical protein
MGFKNKQTWQSLKRYMFKGFSKEGERRVGTGIHVQLAVPGERKVTEKSLHSFIHFSFLFTQSCIHSCIHSFPFNRGTRILEKKRLYNCCSVVVPYALMTSQLHRVPGTQPDAADAPIAFVIGMLRGIPFYRKFLLLQISRASYPLHWALTQMHGHWTMLSIIQAGTVGRHCNNSV